MEVQVQTRLYRLSRPAVSATTSLDSPHLSLQFYLPDETVVTKDHLKAVFTGQKQLLKKSEVKEIKVPKYEELSVKTLYPQFTKDPEMMYFFPDTYPAGKGPPRDYFFNVLNTIHPDYLAQVMAHANK